MMFPFVLTFIGILVIFAGVQYQRNQEKIAQSILGLVPPGMKKLLPRQRLARS
ncbi:MAG: hypothetical protein LAP21_03980 [Acidobacteriia bacterium]|nr:hypothetical protein [Terriglobia bacterium]